VFLTGGAYGAGKWALLDHDISTVIFDDEGRRLLGIQEIVPRIATLRDPNFKPERQRGWRVSGLHDDDAGGVYTSYRAAEYLAGYAGPPPRVHLRKGESMRRYLRPGLEDGKTFVFWGMNYNTAGIPGPERSRTWVNQPEKMFGTKSGTPHVDGQARFGNAVFTYTPDFGDGSYKEGVVSEGDKQVTFEFRSPYVIGATPANNSKWGVYAQGASNGLVIAGKGLRKHDVAVSVDHGRTWNKAQAHGGDIDSIDATDLVKGRYGYWLAIDRPAELKDAGLTIRTVCQCNPTIIPHMSDGTNTVMFESSGLAYADVGPGLGEVEGHVLEGKLGSKSVTLGLKTPWGERAVHLYAASWQASGNPPDPQVSYGIDYSGDGGKTWQAVVKDWRIERRAPEPADFWSQSFTWGDVALAEVVGPVRVRFTNTGGKTYRGVEAHLAYRPAAASPATVTFAWKDKTGRERTASHTYPAGAQRDRSWTFDAGQVGETSWVEYAAK
jgi:hypothetical protein